MVRGASGPKIKPIQDQSLAERPRRAASQPDRKVHTPNRRNRDATAIISITPDSIPCGLRLEYHVRA